MIVLSRSIYGMEYCLVIVRAHIIINVKETRTQSCAVVARAGTNLTSALITLVGARIRRMHLRHTW